MQRRAGTKEQRSTFDAWFGMTPFIDVAKLVEGGVLEPWDTYIPADIKSDIFPSNVQEGSYQGKLYSWPQFASATGLNYRPSMLKQAGYENPPATWDEMLKVASNAMDYQAATALYTRGLGLIKRALGKG